MDYALLTDITFIERGSFYVGSLYTNNTGSIGFKSSIGDISWRGQIVKLSGHIDTFRGKQRFNGVIHPVDASALTKEVLDAIVPKPSEDVHKMMDAVYTTINTFTDDALYQLTNKVIQDYEDVLVRMAASMSGNRAYAGGLLEHIYNLVLSAKACLPVHKKLNPDLLYAGLILHDIGRIAGIVVGENGIPTSSTVLGDAVNHMTLGCSIVYPYAVELEVANSPTVAQLMHIILQHHSLPREPICDEFVVVHGLDIIDERISV